MPEQLLGRGKTLRHALVRKKVAAVRDDDVGAVAAGPSRAEGCGG